MLAFLFLSALGQNGSVINPLPSPRLRTAGSNLHVEVPPGGNICLTKQGGDSVCIDSLVAAEASLATRTAATDAAFVANNLSISAAIDDISGRLTQRVERADRELRSLVNSAITALNTTVTTATAEMADRAEFEALRASLAPAVPVVTVTGLPFGAEVTALTIEAGLWPVNLTIQLVNRSALAGTRTPWQTRHVLLTAPVERGHDITVLTDLEAFSNYSVRTSAANRIGSTAWSPIAHFATLGGTTGEAFSCTSPDITFSGAVTRSICSVTIRLTRPAIVYAGVTGGLKSDSGGSWVATGISIARDQEQILEENVRQLAASYSESHTWEQFHSARASARVLQPGTHVIDAKVRCPNSGTTCRIKYAGMHGFYVDAEDDSATTNCKWNSWSKPWSHTGNLCTMAFTSTRPMLVAGTLTGHQHTSGSVYQVVTFDDDSRRGGAGISNTRYLPSHSYSRNWESWTAHRTKMIANSGRHTVGSWNTGVGGAINGAGFSMLAFAAEPNHFANQHIFCRPSQWAYTSLGEPTTVCVQQLTLPFDAIVYVEQTGHYWTNGGWGMVGMMVDAEEVSWMRGSMSGTWAEKAIAIGKSGSWETINSKRTVKLAAGQHTVTLMVKGEADGSSHMHYNGGSMDGFWFRAASPAQ
jgi:hypothetical protein